MYDRDFRLHISRHPERSWGVILHQSWVMRLKDRITGAVAMSFNKGNGNGGGANKNMKFAFLLMQVIAHMVQNASLSIDVLPVESSDMGHTTAENCMASHPIDREAIMILEIGHQGRIQIRLNSVSS